MDQGHLDWRTVTFEGSAVWFRYPAVTPQGQTVERVEERAEDHRGDIESVHLSSADERELYVEVVRFRHLTPQDEYEQHRPYLERRFGVGSVAPLTESSLGEQPAWAYSFRWEDGERSVRALHVDGDTYRVIWNPRSELNAEIVATVATRP